ncbi:MAG: hypothetical protein ING40_07295 [Burkholderiales bacterium]|nr:hypothetical protein [Burkholderiales bacterium]MCA3228823.1 hypothetical protein [Burkholderiales bacterium]
MWWFRATVAPAQARVQSHGQSQLAPGLRRVDPFARRSAIGRLAAVLGLAGGLVACGFRLRGSQSLPFATLFLGFPPNSPLGAELSRNIQAGTGTRVVADRRQAEAVLEMLGEQREREVLAVDAQGRTREYRLRLRLTFRVHDGKGNEFVPPGEIVVSRDLAFNEAQVLAREAEEALLLREMQTDAVQQMLRRIAAARPPAR